MNHSKRKFIIATPDLETSVAGEEIIPKQKNGQPYAFYNFDFLNKEDCTISVNNSEFFQLGANQGLRFGIHDPLIYSVIIQESGIPYKFIGGY